MAYAFNPPEMSGHAAVHMENSIIVFGGCGRGMKPRQLDEIWMYNLYIEQWGKHVITDGETTPPLTIDPCAVIIKADIYMFGGFAQAEGCYTDAVWKLTRMHEEYFVWSEVVVRSKVKTPSPRSGHSGWEYEGRLWTFGGAGPSLVDYLNDHGDFDGWDYGNNNQLLCFDPLSENWRNPQTFGAEPEPRAHHATTVILDKVWLYGGNNTLDDHICDELFHLDMTSLTWTEIQIGGLKPPCRDNCSLTTITEHHLVLHGGQSGSGECFDDTWIFDLPSLSWKKHSAGRDHPRSNHAGTVGVSSTVIIIGGEFYDKADDIIYCNDVFSVRLEPKSLQQLAMLTVYNHRDMLAWKHLPTVLIARCLFPVRDNIPDELRSRRCRLDHKNM